MINCPGPYSYDGRDKGRRAGITQQQRARVTYSLSWISVRSVSNAVNCVATTKQLFPLKARTNMSRRQCKNCKLGDVVRLQCNIGLELLS